jgi:hypothetical protein
MAAKKEKSVRVNPNHSNQVLSRDEHMDPCAGRYHAEKKVLNPQFAKIDPKAKRQQEFYGTEQVNTVHKKVH